MNVTAGKLKLEAGYELLQKYQSDWENIHKDSVCAVSRSNNVEKAIKGAHSRSQMCEIQFQRLNKHLGLLGNVLEDVQRLASSIGELGVSIEEVASVVAVYESACHQHNDCKTKIRAKLSVDQLKLDKRSQLEEIKEAHAKEYRLMLEQVKSRQPEVIRIRREALKQALDLNDEFEFD